MVTIRRCCLWPFALASLLSMAAAGSAQAGWTMIVIGPDTIQQPAVADAIESAVERGFRDISADWSILLNPSLLGGICQDANLVRVPILLDCSHEEQSLVLCLQEDVDTLIVEVHERSGLVTRQRLEGIGIADLAGAEATQQLGGALHEIRVAMDAMTAWDCGAGGSRSRLRSREIGTVPERPRLIAPQRIAQIDAELARIRARRTVGLSLGCPLLIVGWVVLLGEDEMSLGGGVAAAGAIVGTLLVTKVLKDIKPEHALEAERRQLLGQ